MTSTAVNVGVGTTNPDLQFSILGTAGSAASSSITRTQQWKTQQAIYATGAYALKLGAHWTAGVGAFSSIQSTEFYSGAENVGALALQPIGGPVGIGITNPTAGLHLKNSSMRITGNLTNGSSRPALTTTPGPYEIRASSSSGDNADDGLLRLSAGGGTNLTHSYIDLSGYSTVADMAYSIVFGSNGLERMRITNTGTVGIGTNNTQGNFLMLHNPGSVSGISLGDVNMTAKKYLGVTVTNGGNNIVDGYGFQGIVFGVPNSTEGAYVALHTHEWGVSSAERMRIAKNGNVGIGITNPSQKLEVIGNIRVSGSVFGWDTSFWYASGTPTWNPGDAGNWPVGGYKFILTLMGHPGLGGNAVRGTYMVFHSRWAAGNNNFCMLTPIGNPQWISSTWITDGGMSFTFNSPSAQMVYIQAVAI